jgi:hypothetical protein
VEEINVEAECKNCNHDIGLHSPKCNNRDNDRLCGCDRPRYYGAVISDEDIYQIIEDETLLCTQCVSLKN